MRLVASTPHAVVLSPWRSSAAVEAWYGSTLEKVVQAMVLDVSYWIKVTYSKNENSIAMDETHEHYAGEFASKLREMGLHVKVENGVSKNREAAVADSLYKTFSAMASGSKIISEKLQGMSIEICKGKTIDSGDGQQCMAAYNHRENSIRIAAGLSVKESTSSGPTLGKFSVGDDFRTVVSHEFGHAIMEPVLGAALGSGREVTSERTRNLWLDVRSSQTKDFWEKNVSKYGASSRDELFAESFAAYTHPGYSSSRSKLPGSVVDVFERAGIKPGSRSYSAMDSPSSEIDAIMIKMGKQWRKTFDHMAHTIAGAFTRRCLTHHDLAMKASLSKAGFSVPFQMTEHMVDRVEGITAENVSLIKSIPAQYLDKVHAKVLESVRKGRDMKDLTKELEGYVELGKPNWNHNQVVRRARFIARQENNKATAAFQQIRLMDLGVDESYWQHTAASKEPRPEHEEWSDEGLKYKVAKGMYSTVAEKWVLPGEDYNCGCTGAPIVPGYNDKGKGSENDEEAAA